MSATKTDQQGRFDLGYRPPVPVSIVARGGDESGVRDVDLGDHVEDGRAWIAIALEPCAWQPGDTGVSCPDAGDETLTLRGAVRSQGGEPVDRARVEIGTLGASRAAAVARSDARGAWSARVPAGCYQVRFAERGSFRQIDGICGQAGETVVVPTAVLDRCTRTTRGMIRVGGILAAGLVVRAGNQRETTNALGLVSFACPSGRVSIAGHELEGSPFAFSTEDQVLVLDAIPRAWIRGRVSLAGKPVGGVRVRVVRQRSDKPAVTTVTSRDGTYEVAVAPGTHLVSAAAHGGMTTARADRPVTIAAGSPGARVDLGMQVPTSMEVVIPEGGAVDLDLTPSE